MGGVKRQREADSDASDAASSSSVPPAKLSKKTPWTPLEDSRLISVVQSNSSGKNPDGSLIVDFSWGEIAELIPNRNAKQCRERWSYNLDPSIKRDSWTVNEDAVLLKAQRTLGNQWALIARYLRGRTENSVKTRYKSLLRAKKREWSKEEDELIMQLHIRMGSKWDAMKSSLPGRTANAIKTRHTMLKKGFPMEEPPLGSSRQIWHQQHLIDGVNLEQVLVQATGSSANAGEVKQAKVSVPAQVNTSNKTFNTPSYGTMPVTFPMTQVGEALKQFKAIPPQGFIALNNVPLKPSNGNYSQSSRMNNRIFHCLQNLQNEILQDQGMSNDVRVKLLSQSQGILTTYLSSISTSSEATQVKPSDVQVAAAALLSAAPVPQMTQLPLSTSPPTFQ
mmetsp:Transcript_10216/g.11741  ORF Transcript_10216/g.11741 Transcript_10216/m.11741 type:complete len:392 (-) Transcript_10216:1182-2357(-)